MQRDKLGHFLAGAAIAFVGSLLSPALGFAAGVTAGALKEAHDSTGRGHVELLDFLATSLGAALGVAPRVVLELVTR